MIGDCLYDAWSDYAKHLGAKTSLVDRIKFWSIRILLSEFSVKPGDYTPHWLVIDTLTLLNERKRIIITLVEFDGSTGYDVVDLLKSKSTQEYLKRDIIHEGITIEQGLFCSLQTKHSYFSQRYRGGDWISLAVQMKRLYFFPEKKVDTWNKVEFKSTTSAMKPTTSLSERYSLKEFQLEQVKSRPLQKDFALSLVGH